MAGLSSSFPVYAPAEDLNAYLGAQGPDSDADSHLADASASIRNWTKTAYYSVGDDGFTPSDQRLADAFHDAAILQAAALYHAKIKPGDTAAGAPQAIQSKTLGSRSVTYATNATAEAQKTELANGALAPAAAQVLGAAGLLGGGFISVGGEWDRDILARKWVSA